MKFTLARAVLLLLLSVSPASAGDALPLYVELADAPTITVDWSKGDTQAVTLGGNRALIFLYAQKGGKYTLILKQDNHGSRLVTWPSSVRCPGLTCPTLTTLAGKTDYAVFIFNGVTYDFLGLSQNY